MGASGAGAGLGFIGNAMQLVAADQAQGAMTDQINSLLGDESYFQTQASQDVGQSIGQAGRDTADQEIAKGTKEATDRYKQVTSTPASASPSPGGAPGNLGANNAWVSLMGSLRAPETGYSEFTLQQMIKNLRTAQQLGVISQLAQARSATLPMNLRQAQHSGDELAGWGKIISSVGSGVSSYGGG